MSFIWKLLWDLSECTGIGLGKLAPFVFGKTINRKGRKINERK